LTGEDRRIVSEGTWVRESYCPSSICHTRRRGKYRGERETLQSIEPTGLRKGPGKKPNQSPKPIREQIGNQRGESALVPGERGGGQNMPIPNVGAANKKSREKWKRHEEETRAAGN